MELELEPRPSPFDDFRKLVAIPSSQQLELIRATATLLVRTVGLGTLRDPSKRFDLRFTYDESELNGHPVAALIVYHRTQQDKLDRGELLLNVLYENLPVLLIHEIAHYFDLYCFDRFGEFSSKSSDGFAEWRNILDLTPTFIRHQAALASLSRTNSAQFVDPETGETVDIAPIIADDWLDTLYSEAFARCFCQWVVRRWSKVSDPPIQAVIDHFHREQTSVEARFLSAYWEEDEMETLTPIMDNLLKPQL